MFCKLPQSIISNIYEYDNTYRKIYSNCIIAFTYKGPQKYMFIMLLKPKWYNKRREASR
jgi:hypothetical protein